VHSTICLYGICSFCVGGQHRDLWAAGGKNYCTSFSFHTSSVAVEKNWRQCHCLNTFPHLMFNKLQFIDKTVNSKLLFSLNSVLLNQCLAVKNYYYTKKKRYAFLACYTALIGRQLPTFQNNLSVPSSRVMDQAWLEDGTDRLSQMLVTTNGHCVKSQKRKGLIYTMAEAWNHASCNSFSSLCSTQSYITMLL
jgi:hypothetical protein